MKNTIALVSMAMLVGLGLGCSSNALGIHEPGDANADGQGGRWLGSGSGTAGATGGRSSAGSAGAMVDAGVGGGAGSGPGGSSMGTGGSSGGSCPAVCPPVVCSGKLVPASDPCGCPQCVLPADAGAGKDAACVTPVCDAVTCATGQRLVTPTCACPFCVSADAGTPDAVVCAPCPPAVKCPYGSVRDPICGCQVCIEPDAGVTKDAPPAKDASPDACPPVMCPAVACAPGTRSVPHPCACPTCEPVDAGADAGKLACVGLDECSCSATNGCAVVSESCYCPYPQCGDNGACICGGGKFLGCAPTELLTCAAAKARVAGLCPALAGATFDSLCQGTDSACVTKCLNEVTSCGELSCTMCPMCDCATDPFMRCRTTCRKQLKL